jgi:hypothetical protein
MVWLPGLGNYRAIAVDVKLFKELLDGVFVTSDGV